MTFYLLEKEDFGLEYGIWPEGSELPKDVKTFESEKELEAFAEKLIKENSIKQIEEIDSLEREILKETEEQDKDKDKDKDKTNNGRGN